MHLKQNIIANYVGAGAVALGPLVAMPWYLNIPGSEQFGYYTIAVSIALGMLQLIYPIFQAVTPRRIHARADDCALCRLNLQLTFWIALLFGSAISGFLITGKPLLEFWLRNSRAVEFVYPVACILLAGTCLNAFYNVGYMNWIAQGQTHRIILVNAVSLALSVIMIPVFIVWKGVVGAAFGWLMVNLIGLMLSLEWVKKKQE